MLLHADQDRALAYLTSCLDQVSSFGDILQLVIVELIYKVRKTVYYTFLVYIIFLIDITNQNLRPICVDLQNSILKNCFRKAKILFLNVQGFDSR